MGGGGGGGGGGGDYCSPFPVYFKSAQRLLRYIDTFPVHSWQDGAILGVRVHGDLRTVQRTLPHTGVIWPTWLTFPRNPVPMPEKR